MTRPLGRIARRDHGNQFNRLAQQQSEMESFSGEPPKKEYRRQQENLDDGIVRLSRPANPTNYLRSGMRGEFDARRNGSSMYGDRPGVASEPASYREISSVLCKYRSKGVTLIPVGKTAEVVRGLFDTSHSRQYLLDVHDEDVEQVGFAAARQRALDRFKAAHADLNGGYTHQPVFSGKAGVGFTTDLGTVYINIHLGEEGGYSLMSDNVTKDNVPTLQANYLWWRDSGFYDAEMLRDGIYKTVYDFIKQHNGTDEDVRALRALVEYTSSRTTLNKAALDNSLKHVSDVSIYQPYIDLT